MEANLFTFSYLFFRLSPFIVASFFSLSSVFNSNFKGIVYLVGLLFSCFVVFVSGQLFENYLINPTKLSTVCTFLAYNDSAYLSQLPFSLSVFGFTFFYLLYNIRLNNYVNNNIPTLTIFPMLILTDIWWNVTNNCFSIYSCILALIVSGAIGTFWSWLIQKYIPSMSFFNAPGSQVCTKPSTVSYKCDLYDNKGQLINDNV